MTRKLPKAVAELTGAAERNPARYRQKAPAKGSQPPLGPPYPAMATAQKAAWRDFAATIPWLTSRHRAIVRLACVLAARIETAEAPGVSLLSAYSAILSKLGATPSDEGRIAWAGETEVDPADRFFQ